MMNMIEKYVFTVVYAAIAVLDLHIFTKAPETPLWLKFVSLAVLVAGAFLVAADLKSIER